MMGTEGLALAMMRDDEIEVFDLLHEKAKAARTLAFVAQCAGDIDGYMQHWAEYGSWRYLIDDAVGKKLTEAMS